MNEVVGSREKFVNVTKFSQGVIGVSVDTNEEVMTCGFRVVCENQSFSLPG